MFRFIVVRQIICKEEVTMVMQPEDLLSGSERQKNPLRHIVVRREVLMAVWTRP